MLFYWYLYSCLLVVRLSFIYILALSNIEMSIFLHFIWHFMDLTANHKIIITENNH